MLVELFPFLYGTYSDSPEDPMREDRSLNEVWYGGLILIVWFDGTRPRTKRVESDGQLGTDPLYWNDVVEVRTSQTFLNYEWL